MKLSAAITLLTFSFSSVDAFSTSKLLGVKSATQSRTTVFGYLDDLSAELYAEEDTPDVEGTTREATKLDQDKVDNYGVGDWSSFVDFDEFDGGDGQMGVAGDGNKKLEKFGSDVQAQMAKSKAMSAKNAWGKATGYAEVLMDKGMEATRAQQLENWMNQQEVQAQRNQQKHMTEQFDTNTEEVNQWDLSKFGVERNQDFDLNEAFGAVVAGDIDGTIELTACLGQPSIYEFSLKNDFMGFADFRTAFTADTTPDWSVEPLEGSLSKEPTNFIVKYRPNNPGVAGGHLVIETEDMKKTYRLIGSTA